VCLDVGETLIDETRVWSIWADLLGVPRLTFMAAFGAAVANGGQYNGVFDVLEVPDWRTHLPEIERRYGGFQTEDLYPDALPALEALREAEYRTAIVANQPRSRTAELRALGVDAEVVAMSEELGVSKPDPAFFRRALELMGDPEPGNVAYVGDRLDNDVIPSAAAGMRAIWLRRGPWGVIHREPAPVAALVVPSLQAMVERIDFVWQSAANSQTSRA
jgi:HAD superfamily hydrolase (TIGR01549 family)